MSLISTSTQWSAFFALLFITLLECIDPTFGRNCNDGTVETINRCRALVESEAITRPPRFTMNRGCTTPNISNSYIVLESNETVFLEPGETVPHLVLIVYGCEPPSERVGPKLNLCYNGYWYWKVHPICTRTCLQSDINRNYVEANCERDGLTVPCDEPIVPGTVARLKCHKHYELANDWGSDTVLCQADGKWNKEPIKCVYICGQLVTRNTALFRKGGNTEVTFVPWHAAIYKNVSGSYEYHCAGTITNEYGLLTAPFCVLKPGTRDIEDKSQFLIGAGKHLGDYNANDPEPQFRSIDSITIYSIYKFAIIQFTAPLVFTTLIGPVCRGPPRLDEDEYIHGNIVNYGREEANGIITRDTRFIPMSYGRTYADCKSLKVGENCATDSCISTLCRNIVGSGFTQESTAFDRPAHVLIGIATIEKHNYIRVIT